MKIKNTSLFFLILVSISCSSPLNSPEFIESTEGRYLFNSDELIEVYFNESELNLKWRGADNIKPLKVDDATFFVKEMNEKIQFLTNPNDKTMYMVLVPKAAKDTLHYNFRKLKADEKIPSEYLNEQNFEKALAGYLTIKKTDSLDPSIRESNFNKSWYKELRDKNFEQALNIFKINMELYPYSANVYDSYADALRQSGDTLQAIEHYKKSLVIDSGNKRAKNFIEKYGQKN